MDSLDLAMVGPIDATGKEDNVDNELESAFGDPRVNKLYANGFYCGRSSSDIFIALQRNGHIDTVLNLSFTCAKSLQQALASVIRELEIETDHSIMTMDEAVPKGT